MFVRVQLPYHRLCLVKDRWASVSVYTGMDVTCVLMVSLPGLPKTGQSGKTEQESRPRAPKC